MQLKNLIGPNVEEMSDDELIAKLRSVRHRREVARPVAKRKAANAEAKASRTRTTAVSKMLSHLSEEDRLKLIEELEKGEGDANT